MAFNSPLRWVLFPLICLGLKLLCYCKKTYVLINLVGIGGLLILIQRLICPMKNNCWYSDLKGRIANLPSIRNTSTRIHSRAQISSPFTLINANGLSEDTIITHQRFLPSFAPRANKVLGPLFTTSKVRSKEL